MSLVQVFDSSIYGSLTIHKDDEGREFFKAIDVCCALKHSNPSQAVSRLVDAEYIFQFEDGSNRLGTFNYLSEPGLYQLIFASKSVAAKAFQRWVFEEILPKLRSRGIYATEAVTTRLKAAMQILQVEQTQRQIMSDGIKSEQFKMDRFIRLIEQYNPRYKDDREELARSIQFLDKFWRADGWHRAEAYDRAEAYPPKYVLKRLQEALDLVAEALDIDLKTDSGLDTHHMMRNPNTLGSVIDFLLSKSQ